MSSEIQIVAPQSIQETETLSLTLAKSALLPAELRGKQADILATILTGAELGLAPMQSLRGIQIIKGKPTLSADTMGALCKRRGDICEYLNLKESTPERVTYETKRKGEAITTMSFTMADAQRAGLAGSDTYKKFPAAMLRARCLSALCRAVYPDLCLGLYDPDELRDLPPESPTPAPAEKEINPPPPSPAAPSQTAKVTAKVQAKVAGASKGPLKVSFGPSKGKMIADLTVGELSAAISLGEEKLTEAPSAEWAAPLAACLADLKQDHGARIERAIDAEAAEKAAKPKATEKPEPGSAG